MPRNEAHAFRTIRGTDEGAAATALAEVAARHQSLVHWVARRFTNRGVAFADLAAEGNIGLLRAIDKFDPGRGLCFSTYATYWIERYVRRALQKHGRLIHIPEGTASNVRKLQHAQSELQHELGREPTDREMGELLQISEDRIRKLRFANVSAFVYSSTDADGADAGRSIEGHATCRDASPDWATATEDASRLLQLLLEQLDEREHRIVRMYFGMSGDGPQTFARIARHFGVSSERVRQIQKSALGRLRRLARPYLNDLIPLCA